MPSARFTVIADISAVLLAQVVTTPEIPSAIAVVRKAIVNTAKIIARLSRMAVSFVKAASENGVIAFRCFSGPHLYALPWVTGANAAFWASNSFSLRLAAKRRSSALRHVVTSGMRGFNLSRRAPSQHSTNRAAILQTALWLLALTY